MPVSFALQGAKLQYGHVPVSARGDDEGGRQFGSLHAVQRPMVDTNQVCPEHHHHLVALMIVF